MGFLDIENIACSVLGYDLSYVELIGTAFGFLSVLLAARANILTWPAGIINEIAFFALFYQVQLYSDMYLQVFFLLVTIYGWYYWHNPTTLRKISALSTRWRMILMVVLALGTLLSGLLISHIHEIWPSVFTQAAAYPYWDALTTVASIAATILLSRKVIDTWILWILVDVIAVVLYALKGIYLVSIEYVIFLIICIFGLRHWYKQRYTE